MKKKTSIIPLEDAAHPGMYRYRRLALVMVAVEGYAPNGQTFDEFGGEINPDCWTPIAFGNGSKVQIACTDMQWHDLTYGLFGDMIAKEGEDAVDAAVIYSADASARYLVRLPSITL